MFIGVKNSLLFISLKVKTGEGSQVKNKEAKKRKAARIFREAISPLSNHLHQPATGGPIVWRPDGQTLKM